MAEEISIECKTFKDIVSIIAARAGIAGTAQPRDISLIKGFVNEDYVRISTERTWSWRKFYRDFVFDRAVTTGTAEVTEGSRVVTFDELVLDNTYLGRAFKATGSEELYRIVGIKNDGTEAYLSAAWVGEDNEEITFKIYQYEFALPPDCDTVKQVFYMPGALTREPIDLDPWNPEQFNRYLSSYTDWNGQPEAWCKDGRIGFNDIPPLDEMLLNYDFLGGKKTDKTDCLRIFPIEPDKKRVIHLGYTLQVRPMVKDEDQPLMPIDNRWILVHFALEKWHRKNGSMTIASSERTEGNRLLQEMRSEYHKSDTKPQVLINRAKSLRTSTFNDKKYLFEISRLNETE